MEKHFLTGESIYLRALEMSDLDRCLKWINDPEVIRYLCHGAFPFNSLREEEWIKNLYKGDHSVTFALCLKEKDLHIGNCGLEGISWVNRCASFGILIGEKDQWSKGYGTSATNLLLDYAFLTLNLHRVELLVYDFNTRGIRCYEKTGFQEEGRFRKKRFKEGKYCDEVLMGILKEEWEKKRSPQG